MKALLLYPDRDLEPQQDLRRHEQALTQDLELDTLVRVMSGGDAYVSDVARKVILTRVWTDIDIIRYRQDILKDCLNNPTVVRKLYGLAVEAFERRRKEGAYGYVSNYPRGILHSAVELLKMFIGLLSDLKSVADTHTSRFTSRGFTRLFAMLQREFSDDYFDLIQSHLKELQFDHGILVSAELGPGNHGRNYALRQPHGKRPNWIMRLAGSGESRYTFRVHERDDAGAQILLDMQNHGVNLVANALAQSVDHILSFFDMLRTELAFYLGCLNLHDKLTAMGIPISFPKPESPGTRRYSVRGLHDVGLALTLNKRPVSNDLDADETNLVIITGANQGGKSSFIRSVGVAQLMMQCGMFVAADSYAAGICSGLYTHYKREEDAAMKRGKLDEELARMSDIVETIEPHAMLLFNESFASTNEREGSEIAMQVVCGLLQRRIRIFFVTHLYEFARGFFDDGSDDVLFLRAERRPDGRRTFRLFEGEPLETSFGEDLYKAVFAPPG